MRYPEKSNKGDTIGIICPSSPVEPGKTPALIKRMEDLGYKVKAADNLEENYGGFMAGTGKTRGEWINKMFADPEVKAVFCVRGGDGSSRIMEYLDYDVIRNNPKIFVGYSDVTNIHLGINQNCDLVTFHGPMVSSNILNDFDDETAESLFAAINADGDFEFKNPAGFDVKVLKEGKAEGILTGGNLSLLSASVGTPYDLDTEGRILFVEEVCEPLSKIEKWMYHLRNSGKLAKCSGILLGQFTEVENEKLPEYDVYADIKDILEGIDIPVMYNVQSGHSKPMMTLPLGAVCTMDTATGKITFKVER